MKYIVGFVVGALATALLSAWADHRSWESPMGSVVGRLNALEKRVKALEHERAR